MSVILHRKFQLPEKGDFRLSLWQLYADRTAELKQIILFISVLQSSLSSLTSSVFRKALPPLGREAHLLEGPKEESVCMIFTCHIHEGPDMIG
jgi:hypothetical protein